MKPQKRIPDPEEQPTLSIPEAGAIFGLSRAASYEAARRQEIPTIRLGRRILVPTAKLRAMLGLGAEAQEAQAS
jgi:helix-turn-helix protein